MNASSDYFRQIEALRPTLLKYARLQLREIEKICGGVTCEGFLAYDDAKTGRRPGVVVVHQWMGLTDYEKSRCEQLAGLGMVASTAVAEEAKPTADLTVGALSQYVWRGWATARINEAADPTTQKRNTAEAVRKILARFPAQGTQ